MDTLASDQRFAELLAARKLLVRVAARLVGDQDAEDLVQDTYCRAMTHWPPPREGRLTGWLLRIQQHLFFSQYQQRKRRSALALRNVDVRTTTPSPATQYEHAQTLTHAYAALGPTHRMTAWRFYSEGESVQEIATHETVGVPTVLTRLNRARTLMKQACLVLLLTVCINGAAWAEHTGWSAALKGYTGRHGASCCGILDCQESTVALLGQDDTESLVMVGETLLTLPNAWVHPSPHQQGIVCFVHDPAPGNVYQDSEGNTRAVPPAQWTREKIRCVFHMAIN